MWLGNLRSSPSQVIASAYIGGLADIADGRPVSIGSFFAAQRRQHDHQRPDRRRTDDDRNGSLCCPRTVGVDLHHVHDGGIALDRNLPPIDAIKASFEIVRAKFIDCLLVWLMAIAMIAAAHCCVVSDFSSQFRWRSCSKSSHSAASPAEASFRRLTGGSSAGSRGLGSAAMSEQRSAADRHRAKGFATKAIHAGFQLDPATGAVNAPIYASSTFCPGWRRRSAWRIRYARTGNPTRSALEAVLAAVEDGTFARAFGSGMACKRLRARAVLRPGDHVVIPDDAYGGTFRLIDKESFSGVGREPTPVPLSDVDAVKAAITGQTRLIWVETPTNPLLSSPTSPR